MVKKWDIIIIAFLMVLSFLPEVILGFVAVDSTSDIVYAHVIVDDEILKEIPLTGQKELKEIEITTKYGTNVLYVEDEKIRVHSATCPDQVCVHQLDVSKPHQMLICLPNRFIVEIVGPSKDKDDTIISQ